MRNLLWVLLLMVAACTAAPTEPEPTPDPIELITEAATNIRESETFRMSVERTGAPYYVETDFGVVDFKLANAQYVAPDMLQATVRLLTVLGAQEVDIFSRGENQWFRHMVLTANTWFNAPFAIGFNPEALISEDTGFQAALSSLINLHYEGRENLEDGTPVHHLSGVAKGEDIAALLANMVVATGEVLVDVFVDQQLLIPVRFVIVQPDTVTEEEPEPTTWTVDVYDVNSEAELDIPSAE